MRRVFDSDATCWHTLDPATRLITSDAPDELISAGVFTMETAPAAGARLVASEYFLPDVNTFAGLASRRTPVGILSRVTSGHPERSTRYRELLAPSGIPFEMRAALVSRGRAWGAVHIARREDKHDFGAEDAAALASVTGAIAEGIRDLASLRRRAAGPGRVGSRAGGPQRRRRGRDDHPTGARAPGHDEQSTRQSEDTPPSSVLALAGFTRSRAASGSADVDAVAVPTSSGWVTLHASLPAGSADGRVAIVVERAVSKQSTAVRLEADGVTPREREVATLLAQGRTNPEIAEALVLSLYTVQDHIKSLFEKTGVSSRQELVARIFVDDYMPHLAERTELTSRGAFVEPT